MTGLATANLQFAGLAERAGKLEATGDVEELAEVEREIDSIVYRLFELTPAEIAHIENALASTRGQGTRRTEGDEDEVDE